MGHVYRLSLTVKSFEYYRGKAISASVYKAIIQKKQATLCGLIENRRTWLAFGTMI